MTTVYGLILLGVGLLSLIVWLTETPQGIREFLNIGDES